MKKINWLPKYSVGVKIMDEQHKKLILMLNRLIGAENIATDSEVISELITQMITYGQEHFKTEENLMAKFGYPQLDQHYQSHAKYKKKVADLCIAVPLDVPVVPQVTLNFLVDWWQNHILNIDMKYKSFFQEKGIH
jgi:hemerythrin-like metal-binding protein